MREQLPHPQSPILLLQWLTPCLSSKEGDLFTHFVECYLLRVDQTQGKTRFRYVRVSDTHMLSDGCLLQLL